MSTIYRLVFHLARTIAIDGKDHACTELHALHGHHQGRESLQSLGHPGEQPTPVCGSQRQKADRDRSEG